MKVCQSCGQKNADTNNFCESCAAPFGTVAAQPPLQQPPPQPQMHKQGAIQPPKKKKKGCLTAVIAFVVIITFSGILGAILSSNTKTNLSSVSPESNSSAQKVDKKTAVGEQDKIVMEYFKKITDAHNKLMDAMAAYSNGKITKLDFYNYSKEVEKYQRNMNISPPNNVPDIAREYIKSCSDMALFSQTVAKNLIKYLDSGKTADLSAAQHAIKQVTGSISVIANNRVKVLQDAGYTKEEIQALVEAE